MPLLDQVKSMKEKGLSDEQISQQLKEQGVKPLEIQEALEQAKIKAAISPDETQQETVPPQTPTPPETQSLEAEEMRPSILPPPTTTPQPQVSEIAQAPQETVPAPETAPIQPQPTEPAPVVEETPEYIYPTPQAYYPEYQPYQPQAETETVTEIAEQIVDEKLNKLKKELSLFSNFKTTAERKIKNIDERLKKIEEIIDKLQASIIGKIGSYGQSLQDIKKEMFLMQESFSKALPGFKKPKTKITTAKKKQVKKTGKKKSGIEHYLRR